MAATTISRLNANAMSAAWRTATLSCRPAKVITPSSQRVDPASALSAVKIAAEMATPNDAPSDEAIL